MSLFADYIKERLGKHIIENEYGFATFYYPDATTVYLEDIYVIPSQRRLAYGRELADQVVEIAKIKGCTRLLGTVTPAANGATESLKAFLAYGMQVDSTTPTYILLSKSI